MTTVSLYHDTRHGSAQSPVKIRITKQREAAFISTGVAVSPAQWDKTRSEVVKHDQARTYNLRIRTLYSKVEMCVMLGETSGRYIGMTVKDVKEDVLASLDMQPRKQPTSFVDFFAKIAAEKERGTAEVYNNTLGKLRRYCAEKDMRCLRFEDITPKWLAEFEEWLTPLSPALNARDIHFRNIKHVFNCAIDEELTTAYPFRKFKHKTEETAKRALSIEELRTLWSYPCEPWQQRWIDVFKLTVYLRGINLADLFYLAPDNYAGGRIVYRRAKTGKLYSVKVEPEAAEIIEKYRGTKYLLNWGDTYKHHRSLTHRINLVLKSIGEVERKGLGGKKFRQPLFPDLSLSDARHTVATLMAELDIPNETIAATLGHSYGNRTTAIYIKPNQNKVDKAMRRIIDYVKNEEETTSSLLTNNDT